jgi:flagellar basal body rod protein FlgG
MDVQDRAIKLDAGAPITIDGRGRIMQRGEVVATLGFAQIADRAALKKEGDNFLRFDGGRNGAPADRIVASGAIHQRHIENSAVDPITALNQLMNASKAVQASSALMQYHDNILGQVINTYGRVA